MKMMKIMMMMRRKASLPRCNCFPGPFKFEPDLTPPPESFQKHIKRNTCGIRTHAGRPHRLSRPTPQPLGQSDNDDDGDDDADYDDEDDDDDVKKVIDDDAPDDDVDDDSDDDRNADDA